MPTTTAPSTPYAKYANLLRRLHLLTREGHGDSPDADALRDEMDDAWEGLTGEEAERLRGLSADLDTIGQSWRPRRDRDGDDQIRREVHAAEDAREWERALRVLRGTPEAFGTVEAANIRGRCWGALEDADSAILFYRESIRMMNGAISKISKINLHCIEAAEEAVDGAADFGEEWQTRFRAWRQRVLETRDLVRALGLKMAEVEAGLNSYEASLLGEQRGGRQTDEAHVPHAIVSDLTDLSISLIAVERSIYPAA